MDHTLQLQVHGKGNAYPVYTSQSVFETLIGSYPHLEKLVTHIPLEYGRSLDMQHAPGFKLTAFPVYHGPAAKGASMLCFEAGGKKVLFTGDLFSTLLRTRDLGTLAGPDILVADTNNRFPWPRTNHWSFSGTPGEGVSRGSILTEFIDNLSWESLTAPHLRSKSGRREAYFGELMAEAAPGDQSCTILEFLRLIRPAGLMPVHYSGTEDLKYHGEPRLDPAELESWLKRTMEVQEIQTNLVMPVSGKIYTIP